VNQITVGLTLYIISLGYMPILIIVILIHVVVVIAGVDLEDVISLRFQQVVKFYFA
jgi:hypothetical protein